MDRRKFLTGAAAASLAISVPRFALAQNEEDAPNFDLAGSAETDPSGYTIAWSDEWEQKDVTNMTFEPIPGQHGFVVLDWTNPPSGLDNQRIVIESHAASELIDPEGLLESFADNYPETDMGYAPGTTIGTRTVTETGCWFSFGAGDDAFVPGVVGLSLFYTPQNAGEPLLNIVFNIHQGVNRTDAHLEMIDSTISINGNWLLNMDELGNFWEAIENQEGFDVS